MPKIGGRSLYLIGLTGGIGSGKSTVSNYLKELGAKIIDGDIIARAVVVPEKPAWKAIVETFGNEILLADLSLNRLKLGEIVFNNKKAKELLENIISPYIAAEINKQLNSFKKVKNIIVVLDLPLLYENNWDKITDENWVVFVEQDIQIKRLCDRNNFTIEQALSRINNQLPLFEKAGKANVVIDNNFDIENTKQQVLANWQEVKKRIKTNERE